MVAVHRMDNIWELLLELLVPLSYCVSQTPIVKNRKCNHHDYYYHALGIINKPLPIIFHHETSQSIFILIIHHYHYHNASYIPTHNYFHQQYGHHHSLYSVSDVPTESISVLVRQRLSHIGFAVTAICQ